MFNKVKEFIKSKLNKDNLTFLLLILILINTLATLISIVND